MSPVGSSRTFLPLALLAALLFAAASGCSGVGDGAIAVQLVYPAPAAAARASVLGPSYPTDPADRIRIRVLAPHFAPIEKWFLRSDGRGEVGGIPPGARIAVEVEDTGVGLPTEDTETLVEPFFSTKGRGSGVGLALVHRIVSDHGGTLELRSLEEGGARVRIVLDNALVPTET